MQSLCKSLPKKSTDTFVESECLSSLVPCPKMHDTDNWVYKYKCHVSKVISNLLIHFQLLEEWEKLCGKHWACIYPIVIKIWHETFHNSMSN